MEGMILGILLGCTTSDNNTIYFASANISPDKPTLTFYRVKIKGKSTLMKTDLQTGFYDANAVRALFGEVAKDTSGKNDYTGLGQYQLIFENGQWKVMDPQELFTIVYGTDAKALTGVIKTYAGNNKLGEQIGSLFLGAAINTEEYKRSSEAEFQADQSQKMNKTLAEDVNLIKESISTDTVKISDNLTKPLLSAAQKIANRLGCSETFDVEKPDEGFKQARDYYKTLKGGK
jgi:hypothetical protein